jgi:hypothetical protein
MGQSCKACGRRDKFDFSVPDEIWAAVVPPKFANLVVCLSCFDDFAQVRGVDYASHMTTLYFVGDRATIRYSVVEAMDA